MYRISMWREERVVASSFRPKWWNKWVSSLFGGLRFAPKFPVPQLVSFSLSTEALETIWSSSLISSLLYRRFTSLYYLDLDRSGITFLQTTQASSLLHTCFWPNYPLLDLIMYINKSALSVSSVYKNPHLWSINKESSSTKLANRLGIWNGINFSTFQY